jgi:hypothetical protein
MPILWNESTRACGRGACPPCPRYLFNRVPVHAHPHPRALAAGLSRRSRGLGPAAFLVVAKAVQAGPCPFRTRDHSDRRVARLQSHAPYSRSIPRFRLLLLTSEEETTMPSRNVSEQLRRQDKRRGT